MFLAAENSSHIARKSGRSNSPRAVERRRLQNRRAQRNHRQRVREENRDSGDGDDGSLDSTATSRDTTRPSRNNRQRKSAEVISSTTAGPTSSQSPPPSLPLSLPSAMMSYPFMSGDVQSHKDDFWPQVDPRSGVVTSGHGTMPSLPCGTTCHCRSHNEQMSLPEETASFPQHQQRHLHQAFETPHYIPKSPQAAYGLDPLGHFFYTSSNHNISSGQSVEPNEANEFNSYKTDQRPFSSPVNCQGSTPSRSNPPSTSAMSILRGFPPSSSGHICTPPKTPTSIPSYPSTIESRHTGSDSSTSNLTQRFDIILGAMRTAGFQDFDSMALAYYTGIFEKGSIPSIVQSSSRSRRLGTLLQELQESSSDWLRWESRGLQEGLTEATASLCVKELERLKGSKSPSSIQKQPTNLVAAVELVLTRQAQSRNNNNNSHKCTAERLSVLDQQDVAPDIIPHLWSLLTELVGIQSMYCDEIARIVLSIFLRSRDM